MVAGLELVVVIFAAGVLDQLYVKGVLELLLSVTVTIPSGHTVLSSIV